MRFWYRSVAPCLVIGFGIFLSNSNVVAQPAWVHDAVACASQVVPHNDAQALILLHQKHTQIGKDGKSFSHIKVATRILKSSAQSFVAFSEDVYQWREVQGLNGWLLMPDGKTKQLKKENIAKVAVNLAAGFYDDAMTLVAAFPEVPAGSVVAWEYDIVEKDPWGAPFDVYTFQTQQPVVMAKYSVELPEYWSLHISKRLVDSVMFKQEGNYYEWTMTNLPYRQTEPFMPSWSYLARRIAVNFFGPERDSRTFADWRAASKFVAELHDSVAVQGDQVAAFASQRIAGMQTPAEKLSAIAKFVQDEIRYVAVEINMGRLVPRPPGSTLTNRYGDCKDKATLMRAMLRQAGIPSVSVLASVNAWLSADLPTPFQFDHVIIAIPADSLGGAEFPDATVKGWVIFDPTDDATPLGAISRTLSDTWVLLGASVDSPLVRLPQLPASRFRRQYYASAELSPAGDITAKLRITDYGCLGYASAHEWEQKEQSVKIEDLRTKLSTTLAQPQIADYATFHDKDSAWITCTVSASRFLQAAGDLNLLKVDFFHDDATATFKAKTREHPVWFGSPGAVETQVDWRVPDTWVVDGTVDSIVAACSACSYSCRVEKVSTGVGFHSSYACDGQIIGSDKYSEAQSFRKQYEKAQALRIVLKKK